jgi:hypothetical protein
MADGFKVDDPPKRYATSTMEGRFTVKGGDEGQLSLALEPYGESLPILGDGWLWLSLADGTSMEQAQDLARQLNRTVKRVAYTGPR